MWLTDVFEEESKTLRQSSELKEDLTRIRFFASVAEIFRSGTNTNFFGPEPSQAQALRVETGLAWSMTIMPTSSPAKSSEKRICLPSSIHSWSPSSIQLLKLSFTRENKWINLNLGKVPTINCAKLLFSSCNLSNCGQQKARPSVENLGPGFPKPRAYLSPGLRARA